MQPDWAAWIHEILQQEINRTGRPVPGAKLRSLAASRARAEGHTFPPPGASKSFSDFLQDYVPQAQVVRQPGTDMLVLPAKRPDLLPTGRDFHVRKDMYDAFTTFSNSASPWYDAQTDRATWRSDDELELGGLIRIPKTTVDAEVALRREFANTVEPRSVQGTLESSLSEALPLRAFSTVLARQGLLQRWHGFRSQRVRERIEAWARDNNLQWKATWLVARREPGLPTVAQALAVKADDVPLISAALGRLEAEDLRRVMIPLDVVAKLLSSK
jgi:hypothetical protein